MKRGGPQKKSFVFTLITVCRGGLEFAKGGLEFAEGGLEFAKVGIEFAIGYCPKKVIFRLYFFAVVYISQ